MKEIVETLLIAIALVAVVVYLFLQDWRPTLIPLLAVPVSLVGPFLFFPVLGFSVNTLSLFGLVLAIGLVVDDAIVVVEAVQRHIDDGPSPKDAALKAMQEIFERATNGYVRLSAVLLRKSAFALLLLLGFGAAGLWIGGKIPTSFVPDEDQGYFYLNVQLPNAASLYRTQEVLAKIQKIASETPGVDHVTAIAGFSLLTFVRTSYSAFAFISMKDWGDRKTRAEQFQAIKAHLNAELGKEADSVSFGFSPPAIPGVGTSGGFTYILEDRSGADPQFLSDNLNKFMAAARFLIAADDLMS